MQNYELLYIVDFDTYPSKSLSYYIDKIIKRGGKPFESGYYSGTNLSEENRKVMEGPHINIKFAADNNIIKTLDYDLAHDHNVIRHIILNWNRSNTKNEQIPKCPFCGGDFHIQLCDEEGNPHSNDYLNDPYSGIFYYIAHTRYDVPKSIECPIAREDYSESIGCYLYESKEEAIAALKLNNGANHE